MGTVNPIAGSPPFKLGCCGCLKENLARILETPHPADVKKLGRAVRGFEEGRWAVARFDIVVRGNLAKFSQHDRLRDYLLATGDRVLVEAAPGYRVWGIGLTQRDPLARAPARWPGLNLLGFALMEVRSGLREMYATTGK